eukprot:scaffold145629_cov20-Tisochrysis_lutea.AAC.2
MEAMAPQPIQDETGKPCVIELARVQGKTTTKQAMCNRAKTIELASVQGKLPLQPAAQQVTCTCFADLVLCLMWDHANRLRLA